MSKEKQIEKDELFSILSNTISGKAKNKCRDCTERKWDEEGKPYCPHATCVFGDNEIEWWRRVGGDTIIDPISGKLRRAVP